jgi:hypothetical protein
LANIKKQTLKKIYPILVALILISCDKPIKVFQVDNDVQHRTIELYKDSTFIEKIHEVEDSYQYSGSWTGQLSEGASFRTIATKKGHQILTLTPKHRYDIIDGQAVENTQPISTFQKTTIWRIDSLDIPKCQMCDDMKMSLKKLFRHEVSIGGSLIMTEKKLLHLSFDGDTLSENNYSLDNEKLEIFGSDWVDYAEVEQLDDKRMTLVKTQRIVYESGTEPPPNDLIIYLKKEK